MRSLRPNTVRVFTALAATSLAVLLAIGAGATTVRAGEDVLAAGRPVSGAGSLADHGVSQLERLPWGVHVLRANLSAKRPTMIAGAYLMRDDLLCVSSTGLIYAMARRDLQPRWVSSLKGRLAQPPAEGPHHYVFVSQGHDGTYFADVFAKRNGATPDGYPVRLPFAVSSPPAANAGEVFFGSLGSVRDAKTVVSYGIADGAPSWGHRTRGLVWAAPTFDPGFGQLVIAGEDGRVTAVPSGGTRREPSWISQLTGAVSVSPVVTPGHVVIGAQDGTLWVLDLGSGATKWMTGLDEPFKGRSRVWVVGRSVTEKKSTGVEGASDVDVTTYRGIVFARNATGLNAFVLETGKKLFRDEREMAKPVVRNGRWVLVADAQRNTQFRDATAGYAVKAELNLGMFDLIPTNSTDGAVYAVTADGGVVAAIPK